jgi:hypothetical protein
MRTKKLLALVALAAGALAYPLALRRRILDWGSTPEEATRTGGVGASHLPHAPSGMVPR